MSDEAARPLATLRSSDAITPDRLVKRVYLPEGHDDGEKAINAAWTAWGILSFAASDDSHGRALRAYILTFVLDIAAQQRVHSDVIHPNGHAALDAEMLRAVVSLVEAMGLPEAIPTTEEEALAEGLDVLPWDEALAVHLDRLGACGRTHAADLRSMSRERAASPERWRRWVEWCGLTNDGVLYRLAMCLWVDRVGPRLSDEARKPAALVVHVFNHAVLTMARPTFIPPSASNQLPLFLLSDGSNVEVYDRRNLEDEIVPTFSEETLDIMQGDTKRLSSLVAIKLFHWAVLTAHRQKLSGVDLYSKISVDGGASQIAKEIGVSTGKYSKEVMDVLRAWDRLIFRLPKGGKGTLISMQEYPAAPGRKARIDITLSPPMLPDYVHQCDQQDRKLVPMPTAMAPLVGAPQDHAACAVLSFLLLREMRLRAKELVREGGILLDEGPGMRATDLADQAGLRRKVLPDVLERWRAADDGRPSFLESNGRRVIVQEPAVKAFLLQAGEREIGAAKAGRLSAEKRAARLETGKSPVEAVRRRKGSP
jgi:hypothetical protein